MTYVDERIVELRFDNKQFEQETAKTMSTLDKLKEKLSFKNASSGAEQLQKAVANINVNPVIQGIGAIETKMSTLGIAGKRIVENIVDLAMSGISKISQKIQAPINQIIQGGKTRAQNIEQAKFMLKGLKVEWDDIKDDINYGVQDTAYGLDAAAKVASQLVASNVAIGKDMKTALRAVSGVAAMTNSSYEDIGHVFTTVAGQGRVMGDQLLQLSTRGLNVAADLGKALGKTESEIRDMVSKGKIDFQTFANAMDELYGEHAKSANETFTGALSNTKAALSRLGADIAAQGFTSIRDILTEIIPKLKEFKNKIKPAEDAIIKMVEAVGKLVQAFIKTIDIEKIVNFISPKIQKFADTITNFATSWKEAHEITHKKYDSLADYIKEARGIETVTEATEEATNTMKQLYEISEEEKQMADDIWKYGTYGNGQDRVDALKEHYEIVQAYVDKMIELGWDEAAMNEYLAKQQEEHTKAIEEETKAATKQSTIQKLVDILKNLKRVFTNVFSSITNVLGAAFDSIGEAFAGSGGGILDAIVIITGKLADFSDKIAITKDRADKLKPIFKTIISVVKLLGTILLNVGKAILIAIGYTAQFFKAVSQNKVVRKIVEAIGTAFTTLKDAIVKVYETIKNSDIWDKFVGILQVVGEFIGDRLVDAFNFFGTIGSTILGVLSEGFGFLVDKVDALITKFKEGETPIQKLKDFITNDILHGSWLEKLKTLIETLFVGKDAIFHTAYEFGSNLVKGFFEGLNNITLDDFEKASKIVAILGTTLAGVKWLYSMAKVNDALTNFTGTFINMLGTLNTTIKKWGRKLDADTFSDFADSIMKIVGSIVAIMFALAYLDSKGFDTHELILIAGGLTVFLVLLVGGLRVLNTWLHKADVSANKTVNILGKAKTPSLALSLFAIGYAIGKIFEAIMSVYILRTSDGFDDGEWMTSLLMIVGVVTGILLGLGLLQKNLKAISGYEGIALSLGSMALLIWAIGGAMKSIAKGIKKYGSGNMWQAFAMVEIMLATLGGIGVLLTLVTGAFKTDKMAGNPFKGMMTMMLGLSILIRLAMIPLFEAIQKAYKSGRDGIDALGDLEDIMKQLMIFIGVLAVVGSLASRTINVGGFNSVAKSGPLFAIAATVAALGLVIFALSKALEKVKDVDTKTLTNFENTLTSLIGIFGLIVVAVSIVGVIGAIMKADIGIAGILLGLAAGIFAIATVIAATAWAFKTFIDTVDRLPGTVDTLLEAFKKVSDNREQLINGLSETVAIAIEGAATGLVTGIQAKLQFMIDNLVEMIADSLSGAADAIMKNAPKFKEGMEKLKYAVAYAVTYGLFGKGEDSAFGMVIDTAKSYVNDEILAALLPGKDSTVGKADWYEKELEDMKKKAEGTAEEKGKETGTVVGGNYYNALYTAQAKEAEKAKKENSKTNLVDIVGAENAEKLANSKAGKAAEKYFGISLNSLSETVDSYASDIKDTWGSINFTDIINQNMPKLTEGTGFTVGTDFLNEFNEVIATGDPELISAWAENYEGIDQISLDQADDMASYAELGFTNYSEGVKAKKEAVENASKEVQDAAVDVIMSYEPEYYRLGKNLTWALSLGIADGDMTSVAINNMGDVVRALKLKAEETAKISSPSKVFFKIGEFITMGLANGILSLSKAAETATENVGDDTVMSLKSVIKRIHDKISDETDINPVITPVLDLSQLEAGLMQMDSMFASRNSYNMVNGAKNMFNDNLASRNAMDIQNTYDDTNVVNAIGELRTDVDTMIGIVGNLGFYIDGRQVASAIADPMQKELHDISVQTGRGVR